MRSSRKVPPGLCFILYCSPLSLPSEVLPYNASMYENTLQDEFFWRGCDLEFLFVNVFVNGVG